MTDVAGFDPLRTADALQVLETEFVGELQGDDAPRALFRLRMELVTVARQAREWAARRGVSTDETPQPPDAGASAVEWVAFLHGLSKALRRIAALATGPQSTETIREVAQWLRIGESGAFLELLELACALDELFKHIEGLDMALRDLGFELMALEEVGRSGDERISRCAEHAASASTKFERLVVAFRRIRDGVRGWTTPG